MSGGVARRRPALTISDVVHAVSTDKVDVRDKPDCRGAEENRGLLAAGCEELMPSACPDHAAAILLQAKEAK